MRAGRVRRAGQPSRRGLFNSSGCAKSAARRPRTLLVRARSPALASSHTMGKGKKSDVQFVLPEPEPQVNETEVLNDIEDEPPYTSIEHSMASGEGY